MKNQILVSDQWFTINWKLRNSELIRLPIQESGLDKIVEILWNEGKFPTVSPA